MRYLNKVVVASIFTMSSQFSFASAPLSQTENPGFYHFKLGNFQVTALSDGIARLPAKDLLINEKWSAIQHSLTANHSDYPASTSINAYLINTGSKLELFDTGSGSFMGPDLGKVLSSLKKSGYDAEQVDDIYITHLHPDHIGGLIADNKAVFPNATIWVEKKEADYWLNAKNESKETDINRPFFSQASQSLAPYIKSGKVKYYTQDKLDQSISVVNSEGHTPGHVFYKITSQGKSLFIIGDLLHVGDVQLEKPDVAIRFDTAPNEATKTRFNYLHLFAKNGSAVAAAHLPFPGVGYILTEGKGYIWKPINYGADIQ